MKLVTLLRWLRLEEEQPWFSYDTTNSPAKSSPPKVIGGIQIMAKLISDHRDSGPKLKLNNTIHLDQLAA